MMMNDDSVSFLFMKTFRNWGIKIKHLSTLLFYSCQGSPKLKIQFGESVARGATARFSVSQSNTMIGQYANTLQSQNYEVGVCSISSKAE